MFPLTWSSLPGAWRGGEPACPAPGTWWWGACSRGEGWEWRGTHGARRVMPHARAPPAPQRTPLPGRLFPLPRWGDSRVLPERAPCLARHAGPASVRLAPGGSARGSPRGPGTFRVLSGTAGAAQRARGVRFSALSHPLPTPAPASPGVCSPERLPQAVHSAGKARPQKAPCCLEAGTFRLDLLCSGLYCCSWGGTGEGPRCRDGAFRRPLP